MKIKYSHYKRVTNNIQIKDINDIIDNKFEYFQFNFDLDGFNFVIIRDTGKTYYEQSIKYKNQEYNIGICNLIEDKKLKQYIDILFNIGVKEALIFLKNKTLFGEDELHNLLEVYNK